MDSAGTRRRESNDFAPAIRGSHRLTGFNLVGAEIGCGEEASVFLHPLARGERKRAAIKPVSPLPRYRPIRPGQVRLPDALAELEGRTVGLKKNGARRFK